MEKHLGKFISLEGVEGVGKSTAVQYLSAYLKAQKIDHVLTREPGGTEIAEKIREVLLFPHFQESMMPETELLLMFASRAQHVAHLIRPSLDAGQWVLSDRFTDASFAYQGGGRGISLNMIQALEAFVQEDLRPHLTILLDAPAEIGMRRAKHRSAADRIEKEEMAFFERIRQGYLERAQQEAQRFRIVDASASLEVVQAQLTQIMDEFCQRFSC